MRYLFAFRRSCIKFYRRFDFCVIPVLRFIVAYFSLMLINLNIGYMEILSNIFVMIAVSVVCALMPLAATVAACILFIILNCFALNLFVGIFAICIFAVIFIFVMRFITEDSLSLILGPISLSFGFPAAVPVALGLLRGTLSVLSGICSVIAWCFLDSVPDIGRYIETDDPSGIEVLQKLIDAVIYHKDLIIYCICFSVTILIVYLIRTLVVNYGFMISAVVGCFVFFASRVAVCFLTGTEVDVQAEILGAVISLVISLVLTFFFFSLEYKRTKRLQFKDDEYYYYVKAVPIKGVRRRRSVLIESDDESDDEDEEDEEDEEEDDYDIQIVDPRESADDGNTKVFPDYKTLIGADREEEEKE